MPKEYAGKSIKVPCTGQAHRSDVDQDHCMVCAPGWGSTYHCPEHGDRLAPNAWCEECRKYYSR